MIAMALLTRPELLIADEPTTATGRIGAGANSATAARAEAGAEHGAAVYHS